MRLPAQAARQLPDQSTTLRVDSSSTDDSRLRGALPEPDSCSAAKPLHSITSSGSDVIHYAGQSGMRKGQLTCFQFRYGEAISGWNRYLNISSPRVRRVALRSSGGKPMI